MTTWLLIRRLRGPAFLLLVGVTALLNQWDVLSFGRSWPLYLILLGVMSLAERAALSQAQMNAYDPVTGQPHPAAATMDTTIYGGPGSSIVPSSPSVVPGSDPGTGRS